MAARDVKGWQGGGGSEGKQGERPVVKERGRERRGKDSGGTRRARRTKREERSSREKEES